MLFRSAGSLPGTLTLTSAGASAIIAGTFTTAGPFNYTLRVRDSALPSAVAATSVQSGVVVAAGTLIISGFSTPESVIHDPIQDVYFVSNVGPGGPGDIDHNGFISRVSPNGQILQLGWISGLNRPKGLWLSGNRLYVADVDTLRTFDRFTGAAVSAISIPNPFSQPLFLNDVVVAPDGTAYVTDDLNNGIFRVTPQGEPSLLASEDDLGGPSGIQVQGSNLSWVTFFSNQVLRTTPSGHVFKDTTLPAVDVSHLGLPPGTLFLEGYIRLEDGRVLFSSWVTGDISLISPAGMKVTLVAHVASIFDPSGPVGPADINVDLTRGRVLIPLYSTNQLMIVPLPGK